MISNTSQLYKELKSRSIADLLKVVSMDDNILSDKQSAYDYVLTKYNAQIIGTISDNLYDMLSSGFVDAVAISDELTNEYGYTYTDYIEDAGWDISTFDLLVDIGVIHDAIMDILVGIKDDGEWKLRIVYELIMALLA